MNNKICFALGWSDIREIFAITPFIHLIFVPEYGAYGLGLCWGFWGIFIAINFRCPQHFPRFIFLK